MSGRGGAFATISVLWRRDLMLFFRQKSRVVGALLQPVLFWFVIGSGMAPTFRLGQGGIGYMEYFFPGVVLMIVLFTSIFATMSVIEDRRQGFLQGVLVAPGSRAAIVLGKSLGSTTVALIQASLFLVLAPLAGFTFGSVRWLPLFLILTLSALALTSLGFALAWALDSTQGYHVVMSLILIPLWVLSGAMFPPSGLPKFLIAILRWNPLSYSVAGVRRALHGGWLPEGTAVSGAGPALEFAALAAAAAFFLTVASWVCSRRASSD